MEGRPESDEPEPAEEPADGVPLETEEPAEPDRPSADWEDTEIRTISGDVLERLTRRLRRAKDS